MTNHLVEEDLNGPLDREVYDRTLPKALALLHQWSERPAMSAAGFTWEPTDAGFPRWTYRDKGIFCVRPPEMTDGEWEDRLRIGIAQSKLDLPPSFFAGLGNPSCSRWCKSEIEWIALAYVQALANGGDMWRKLSKEECSGLLTEKQLMRTNRMLENSYYDVWFRTVAAQITDSDGAFGVGGFWHRGRATPSKTGNTHGQKS